MLNIKIISGLESRASCLSKSYYDTDIQDAKYKTLIFKVIAVIPILGLLIPVINVRTIQVKQHTEGSPVHTESFSNSSFPAHSCSRSQGIKENS